MRECSVRQLFRSKNQSCECQLHDEALRTTLPGVTEVFIGFSGEDDKERGVYVL